MLSAELHSDPARARDAARRFADALDAEMLAGALLGVVATKDTSTKEGWRKAGVSFFQRGVRKAASGPDRGAANDAAPDRNAASA